MEALELAVAFVLDVTLTYQILFRDIERISPGQRARSWNVASCLSAIALCQRLCLVVHFSRTRRSPWGFALGVGWVVAITLVVAVAIEVTSWLVEVFAYQSAGHGARVSISCVPCACWRGRAASPTWSGAGCSTPKA